jgi:hypothetical protein
MIVGCGESAVTKAPAPPAHDDSAMSLRAAWNAMPPDADLVVAVHPALVHEAAAGRVLSLAWEHWGTAFLDAGVLNEAAVLKTVEQAQTVFLGARFAERRGFQEIVLSGIDTKKRHPDVDLSYGGVLSRPMDGVFVIRWGAPAAGRTGPPKIDLDAHAAMSAWVRLDHSHLPGLEGNTVPQGSIVRCEVRVESGFSAIVEGAGAPDTPSVLSARWGEKLDYLRTNVAGRLIGLHLLGNKATVSSTSEKATAWVALDRTESNRFADMLEGGFGQLASSNGQNATSIIAGRGVDYGSRDAYDANDGLVHKGDVCRVLRDRVNMRRQQFETGRPILGVDAQTGEVRSMTHDEASRFVRNFGSVTNELCD